jgi:hypothetical protein
MDLVIDFIHDNIVTKYTSLQPHATHTEFACVYLAGLTTSWFFSVLVPAIDYALFYTQKSKRDQRIKKIMMEHTEGPCLGRVAFRSASSLFLFLIAAAPSRVFFIDRAPFPFQYLFLSAVFAFRYRSFAVEGQNGVGKVECRLRFFGFLLARIFLPEPGFPVPMFGPTCQLHSSNTSSMIFPSHDFCPMLSDQEGLA